MTVRSQLRSPEPRRRMRAIHRLGAEPADRYALREVLCLDLDARVRARAAHRLGSRAGLAMIDSLIEAASLDSSPLVRETSWRSVARANGDVLTETHFEAALHAAAVEPV